MCARAGAGFAYGELIVTTAQHLFGLAYHDLLVLRAGPVTYSTMENEIAFILTEQDYADAARSQYWHRLKSPKKSARSLGALAVIFGLFAYTESYDFESFLYNLIPYVLIVVVIGPLVAALIYLSAGRHARRMFRQQPVQPENRASWNEEGLRIESRLGSLNAKWSDFYGWRNAGRMYFIHMNEALYYLIPAHALSAEQAIDLESTLARQGVVRR